MLQDPNIERVIKIYTEPLQKQISMLQIELGAVKQQCNIANVVVPKGTLCPICGEDESIEDWQTYYRCKMCDTKF